MLYINMFNSKSLIFFMKLREFGITDKEPSVKNIKKELKYSPCFLYNLIIKCEKLNLISVKRRKKNKIIFLTKTGNALAEHIEEAYNILFCDIDEGLI